MRLLFSAVPAHGHLLPFAPLMEAALAQDHAVAVTTSEGMDAVVHTELPVGVGRLPAGPMPLEFSMEGVRRTGADLMAPLAAETVGEIFGGARLDSTIDEALDRARGWRPDVVVADLVDTVGPVIAAELGVPWHAFGMTATIPTPWLASIDDVAASRYAARGLTPVAATSYLDPWPPALHEPGHHPARGVPVQWMRARPHRRPHGGEPGAVPTFSDPSKPTVLVTLGTTFSDTDTLATIVDVVAGPEVNVLVTLGVSLQGGPVTAADRDDRDGEVRSVAFAPMDLLLDGTSVVVGVAGAGTVLAAASRGIPMVLWPRTADTPMTAERARAAGVAITVGSAAEVGDAVSAVLADPGYRERAAAVAAQIAEAPEPDEIVRRIVTAAEPLGRQATP